MKKLIKALLNPRSYGYILFWIANVLLLTILLTGFTPIVLVDMFQAARSSLIPLPFLLMALALTILPIVAMTIAIKILKNDPDRIFTFGYGVELPIFILLLMRLFMFQEITPSANFVILATVLGVSTLMWQILDPCIDQHNGLITVCRALGMTVLVCMGVYIIVWLAFYAVPIIAGMAGTLINLFKEIVTKPPSEWRGLSILSTAIVMGFIWATLLTSLALIFFSIPIAVPSIYFQEWRRSLTALSAKFNNSIAVKLGIPLLALFAMALIYGQTTEQPQQKAAALLQKPPATLADANTLLAQQETIRVGLLNAYLAPQRYFSAVGELDHVRDLYEWGLKLPRPQALQMQAAYEWWVRPFLYQPIATDLPNNPDRPWENRVFRAETKNASERYEQFFDQPINKAERETIVKAVKSTWSGTRANEAWQAVDDREIWLKSQALTIDDQGLWADFELYEVYLNKTGLRQEVVYYFSLPESAVVTGVWLGNGPARDQRFAYRISPRGAAQSLYRNEVRQNRDPALVEQIGPRQYRLRVFPIEPPNWRWDASSGKSIHEDAPEMHMWLTWRVMQSPDMPAWVLPSLAEKRNVYWDADSQRRLNNNALTTDLWLPPTTPRKTVNASAAPQRIDLPNGSTVTAGVVTKDALPKLPPEFKLAVVVDRSRSMTRVQKELESSLSAIQKLGLQTSPDVYLTSPASHPLKPEIVPLNRITPDMLLNFGGQNPSDLINEFNALYTPFAQSSGHKGYGAVLVLTDDSGYEQNKDTKVNVPNAPLWVVHLGAYPLGYDDSMLQAIQASGGGVANSVDEALTRIAVAQNGYAADTADVVDDILWLTLPTETANARPNNEVNLLKPDHPLAAFAARRAILSEMQKNKGTLMQTNTLDALHALAKKYSIVTPYSSMIVLVNEQQRKQLDALEQQADRFNREKETVGETTNEDDPTVTGVPEPEEWLLMGLAAGLLGWVMRRRAQKRV